MSDKLGEVANNIQQSLEGTHHGTSSQKYETWHSLCLVHARNISQVIKVIPDVMLEEQHSTLLLTVFMAKLAAMPQNLLAASTGLRAASLLTDAVSSVKCTTPAIYPEHDTAATAQLERDSLRRIRNDKYLAIQVQQHNGTPSALNDLIEVCKAANFYDC